jgi:hypothetical protein
MKLLYVSTLALGIAAAAAPSYNVTLSDTVSAAGTQLSAGDYKVEMQGDKAVFKAGKKTFAVPAQLQPTDQKNPSTTAVIAGAKLREIDLAGTKSKIVFAAE